MCWPIFVCRIHVFSYQACNDWQVETWTVGASTVRGSCSSSVIKVLFPRWTVWEAERSGGCEKGEAVPAEVHCSTGVACDLVNQPWWIVAIVRTFWTMWKNLWTKQWTMESKMMPIEMPCSCKLKCTACHWELYEKATSVLRLCSCAYWNVTPTPTILLIYYSHRKQLRVKKNKKILHTELNLGPVQRQQTF